MARTLSKMMALGTKAPDFKLKDTEGRVIDFGNELQAKGYLVMFICNHCPFVVHIAPHLAKATAEYLKKGIKVFAINSNDVENYPDDSPEKMKIEVEQRQYKFPYLFDETQEVAKAYDAACTPDFFLFNSKKELVYRGQYDDSRPGSGVPVTGEDLTKAINALVEGVKVAEKQKPSMGCNIKWKSN